jgi:hypothetical protein
MDSNHHDLSRRSLNPMRMPFRQRRIRSGTRRDLPRCAVAVNLVAPDTTSDACCCGSQHSGLCPSKLLGLFCHFRFKVAVFIAEFTTQPFVTFCRVIPFSHSVLLIMPATGAAKAPNIVERKRGYKAMIRVAAALYRIAITYRANRHHTLHHCCRQSPRHGGRGVSCANQPASHRALAARKCGFRHPIAVERHHKYCHYRFHNPSARLCRRRQLMGSY